MSALTRPARSGHRTVLIVCLLVAAVLLSLTAHISGGEYPLTMGQVAEVLLGGGTQIERTIVIDWRLPGALVGLGAGAALGAAGAVTQSLARNPLASPDIIGISMGASVGAVSLLVIASGSPLAAHPLGVPIAALAGGLLTATAIWALAWRGGTDRLRLVLVGVGVNTLAGGLVTWLLVLADRHVAADATLWLAGSLTGREWRHAVPLLVLVVLAAIPLLLASYDLRALHLGDDVAQGLGVPVSRTRALLWLGAILLTAAAVAACGPIGFVALAAPQLARSLFGLATPPLAGGALVGAALVLAADLAAPPTLPVGVMTAALGGPFLLYLLVANSRRVTL